VSEPFEIHNSWIQTQLGEIVNYGKTDKAEPTEIPSDTWVLELEDIEKDSSKRLQRLTFAQRQSKSTKNRFRVGDVLYGKLRPYLNKVLIADEDGYCTTEIIPLQPGQVMNGRFLFYWLKHPTFLKYVESISHGLNMPRLGTKAGKQAPFVLAPLNEQKRIADKLDRILARVDACREKCDRIPLILKRFRQAVLAAATSGELTEDWREDNGRDLEDWTETTVGELIDDIEAGINVRCEERPPLPHKQGLVKISAVTWGTFNRPVRKLKGDKKRW
jgi:type I restriction enzyme, S subunit